MVISSNNQASILSFEKLVNNVTIKLNEEAEKDPDYYASRNAQKLEQDVYRILQNEAISTVFEGTIELVSGHSFPDIISNRYYGIEVKTSKGKWTSTGNSVLETTRVDEVENIFVTFGKLSSPIKFISRKYEEVLYDITVTHYPRYKIDMMLEEGKTIFDKMETDYETLRNDDDPVKKIADYYKKSVLKEGETLWWIDNKPEEDLPKTIRLWSTLTSDEKDFFTATIFAYFPCVFSSSSKKYDQPILWMASKYGIINTHMRDTFSAGGKVNIQCENNLYKRVPKIFERILFYNKEIKDHILSTNEEVLKDKWKEETIQEDRITQWINLAVKFSDLSQTRKILTDIFITNNCKAE